jgi:hypothetical protein
MSLPARLCCPTSENSVKRKFNFGEFAFQVIRCIRVREDYSSVWRLPRHVPNLGGARCGAYMLRLSTA